MIPLGSNIRSRDYPIVTWTIIALLVLIFLWDRQGNPFGPSSTFVGLTMIPQEVVNAMEGGSRFPLVTLFTSMFLHGSILHIVGNLIFLLVFGPLVESALGSARYTLYYLGWGVLSGLCQVLVNPHTMAPTLGASGAISGVLGSYFLLFPSAKIQIIVPILVFLDFDVPAWVLLGLWFLYQILIPQSGVANWAHVGGFLFGMLTVMVLGGRKRILKGREQDFRLGLYT